MTVDSRPLNEKIVARAGELYASLEEERSRPALFDERRWMGRVIGWSLKQEELRTNLLRFVDVFPSLTTSAMVAGHVDEYFGTITSLPGTLRWLLKFSSGGRLTGAALGRIVGLAVERLGRQFIIGEDAAEAVRRLSGIRKEGCAFSIDVLGEAVLSEAEAADYGTLYYELLDALVLAAAGWPPLGASDRSDLDWGSRPKISLSLKPTALYSQARPQAFDESVEAMLARILPVYEKVIRANGSLCIDMESYQHKEMFLELFKRLRASYPGHDRLAIAMQSYLRDTDKDLAGLLDWSRERSLPIAIRLVKGAYWDYEVMRASQNGWDCPVHMHKARTDAAFERQARLILENHDIAYLACGSHNIRSIAAVLETARALGVGEERYEFQVLYGMAEPVRRLLVKETGRVRLYCPSGKIVPGMAYLVRRLLENTANQGFLRLMFTGKAEAYQLVRDPAEEADYGGRDDGVSAAAQPVADFRNEPVADFSKKEERQAFRVAIESVRGRLGGVCPLFINGKEKTTEDRIDSTNPAEPNEVIALVCQAGKDDVDEAIAAAEKAFAVWREVEASERAAYLRKAAAWMRSRKEELAAWQVLEIGKQWDQASADVAEAIDFLEYYAAEMTRLGGLKALPSPPGELNWCLYEPRGVAAVIAPWNFPLAITTGMASAAIVAGNCVVYKPSPLTPVIGSLLSEAFRASGLPPGVFNFVPGRTEVVAQHLVDHPLVTTIAFTGSTQVGLKIIESAGVLTKGQTTMKRVICEMGGKNAIIIDEDADLDEAVPAVLVSAFGFQGQKCSSCSRVIVLDAVHDAFVARLVEAARSLPVGPAWDPAFVVGPVCDAVAWRRIMGWMEIAKEEGTILYSGAVPEGSTYVPVTVVGGIEPRHRLAQEEIFGPVLAVMKVRSFDEALEWANSTRFALTGGVFSRSPRHLEEAKRRFRVGNLYLNRQITGALVARQPFGGMRLSGLGTKAGGSDYLLHFMDPRVITENTARRGFAPDMGPS